MMGLGSVIEIEGEPKRSLKCICRIDESEEIVAGLLVVRGNKT